MRMAVKPISVTTMRLIKGTRLSVKFIFDLLKQGWKEEDILENHPHITHEDIAAYQQYQKVKRASISN